MKRILLEVAYDGTAYCGWQIQPNGITIEEKLNQAISALTGEVVQIIGASRTDSGVHARCNVAVFDTNATIPPNKFSYALNQRLPDDIQVQESKEVSPDFHPRYCKSIKTYEYSVWCGRFSMPINRLYMHEIEAQLDVKLMQQGADYLMGEHDFRSFCASKTNVDTTVRTIKNITVTSENQVVTIKVEGYGFLYNMVRIIAGTLIQVGMGVRKPEDMVAILEAKDRREAGPTAPAKGLVLQNYTFI